MKKPFSLWALVALLCLLGCRENSDTITGSPGEEWGEISNGLRSCIQLDTIKLSRGNPAYSTVTIENVSDSTVSLEAYAGFSLYDSSGLPRYSAIFDIMTDGPSDWHSKSTITLEKRSQLKRRIEISKLGWVLSISSKPPDTDFYELVMPGEYDLRLDIEVIKDEPPNEWIRSNTVPITIE